MTHITRQDVHSYLVSIVSSEPRYLRARDIARDLGGSPKAVGQYLRQLQEDSIKLSIEQWGRSKSTTWRVEASEP